ncbi:hypothetical protein SCHPADRAFT_124681 [Schizopora paradoxa]|uniref:Nephrocystin 3-like N-terminal domain-containing protein n=1 Tax=Schizopora paradoxa TaxID=27342 RepID=A0A0H2S371_9AGAM|nr:hypothetical protein SCHPADRAFT_124681 [Schizopora paradoxa]
MQSRTSILLVENAISQGMQTQRLDKILSSLKSIDRKARLEAIDVRIESIRRAHAAAFDSHRPRPIDTCHGETCKKVLELIKNWATNVEDGQPHILWLSGISGTGKSTIAKTISKWADEEGILGSSYFFARDDEDLSKSLLVIPTIAYHIAMFDPLAREAIAGSLVNNGDVVYKEIEVQFKRLITDPLLSTYGSLNPKKLMLLVIDAPDECRDQKGVCTIIRLFSDLLSSSNPHIRVFLMSRPEIRFNGVLDSKGKPNPVCVHYKLEDFVSSSDIKSYLRHGLSEASGRFDWPNNRALNSLVKNSKKLYIYASVAIRFIGDGYASDDCTRRLEILLGGKSAPEVSNTPFTGLDQIYLSVLRDAIARNGEDTTGETEQLRKIIGAITQLREPLPATSLAELLQVSNEDLRDMLRRLGSIIILPPPDHPSAPPRFFHCSLPDFVKDEERCADKSILVNTPNLETFLCSRSLEVMIRGLTGEVETSYDPVLRHACKYWAAHLSKAGAGDDQVLRNLDTFTRHHLLAWFTATRAFHWQSKKALASSMKVASAWTAPFVREPSPVLAAPPSPEYMDVPAEIGPDWVGAPPMAAVVTPPYWMDAQAPAVRRVESPPQAAPMASAPYTVRASVEATYDDGTQMTISKILSDAYNVVNESYREVGVDEDKHLMDALRSAMGHQQINNYSPELFENSGQENRRKENYSHILPTSLESTVNHVRSPPSPVIHVVDAPPTPDHLGHNHLETPLPTPFEPSDVPAYIVDVQAHQQDNAPEQAAGWGTDVVKFNSTRTNEMDYQHRGSLESSRRETARMGERHVMPR